MRTATHRYTGPTTPQGLRHGTAVRIRGRRNGGRIVEDLDGRRWLVGSAHVSALDVEVTADGERQAQARRWRRRRRG